MAGLSGLSEVFTFKTDTTAPRIQIPAWWYIWENGELTVTDTGSKLLSIGYEIRDPQNRWKKIERGWTPNTGEFTHTIAWNRVFADGVLAPIGSYNVTIHAIDNAGNRTERTARILIPAPNATPIPTSTPTPTEPSPRATERYHSSRSTYPTERDKDLLRRHHLQQQKRYGRGARKSRPKVFTVTLCVPAKVTS